MERKYLRCLFSALRPVARCRCRCRLPGDCWSLAGARFASRLSSKSEWQPLRATVQCECSVWRRGGALREWRSERSKGGERGRTQRLRMDHALNGNSSSKRNDKYVQQCVTHGKGCSDIDATLRPIDGRFTYVVDCCAILDMRCAAIALEHLRSSNEHFMDLLCTALHRAAPSSWLQFTLKSWRVSFEHMK